VKFIAITINGQIDRFLPLSGIRLAVVHREPPNADLELHWKDGVRKLYFGEEADCIYAALCRVSTPIRNGDNRGAKGNAPSEDRDNRSRSTAR
jgi:hypothetical protein